MSTINNLWLLFVRVGQIIDDSGLDVPNKALVEKSGDSAALTPVIQTVLQVTFGTMGAVAVLIITIAGTQYILSNGDPQRIAKAKDAIIYALIGLVVAILAFSIVTFVLDGVFG